MPTNVAHYASLEGPSRGSKPYGMGETTGAYSDTPRQVANLNGGRAYESMRGRMEGIAIEAYEKLAEQRRFHADYASAFNLVWYGLQPLNIGLPDTTKAPTLKDGVFFGAYREGVAGVQPERLGPYCTTLNPGYDPRLPLYKPWPLFDAIKAGFAPGQPAPSPYDHRAAPAPSNIRPLIGTTLAVLGSPGSRLSWWLWGPRFRTARRSAQLISSWLTAAARPPPRAWRSRSRGACKPERPAWCGASAPSTWARRTRCCLSRCSWPGEAPLHWCCATSRRCWRGWATATSNRFGLAASTSSTCRP